MDMCLSNPGGRETHSESRSESHQGSHKSSSRSPAHFPAHYKHDSRSKSDPGGGPSLSRRRHYYDRGCDRYDDRDYYSRSYRRRSPYYSRGGYRAHSRSRSSSPRHY